MSPRRNDANIADDTVLWRAVHKLQVHKNDEGLERAQSWAFESGDNEMSAWIATETNLGQLRTKFPESRIAEFTVGEARECRNIVARDPVGDDTSHVVVCPLLGKSRAQIKKDARRLASRARLLP